MKLGLGLYRHMLTTDNFRFAKQAGATHIIAHLVNYFDDLKEGGLPAGQSQGGDYGRSTGEGPWTYEQLRDLKAAINAEGLELAAIENFDPAHWYDVLMDGPRKQEQLEDIKAIIRNMGEAGIPVMGYYFSLAGVYGWTKGPWARGGAVAVGYVESMAPAPSPIPAGQIWNMTYDASAPSRESIPATSEEEVWSRLTEFLREVVPVAEEARVRLASHPDDPPLPVLRETGRLIYNPERYQRLLDIVPNHHNALEFCVGAISEMNGDMDIYQAIDAYSKQGKIAYVHLRNVRGKVPNYHEVFVDEGDTDMFRVLRILYDNGFEGVIIPDHVPEMTCDAPWHAGMAHALGWMRATLTAIERGKI